jgi:hypothetical protein
MPPRLNLLSARTLLRSPQCTSTSSRFSSGDSVIIQQSRRKCTISPSSRPGPIARTRPALAPVRGLSVVQRRSKTSPSKDENGTKAIPKEEEERHAQDPLPDVSGEAAEIAKIMGKKAACSVDGGMGGPELEQGTPVVDVSRWTSSSQSLRNKQWLI